MRHRVDQHGGERPVGDLYLTPLRWVRLLGEHLRVSGFTGIWDPCASGAAPWTVGGDLARAWGLTYALSDLYPRGEGVLEADYFSTPRPTVAGALLQVGNPPYDVIDGWLARWRATARPGDAAIWLTAYDSVPVAKDRCQDLLGAVVQPRERVAFRLRLEDVEATGRQADVQGPCPDAPDLLGRLPTHGKSHAWMVYWMGTREGAAKLQLGGDPPLLLDSARGVVEDPYTPPWVSP